MKVVQKHEVQTDEEPERKTSVEDSKTLHEASVLGHDNIKEFHEQQFTIRNSLRAIFSWHNYRTYLATAWVYNAFAYLSSFFNVYLWNIIPSFIIIGAISTITSAISAIARFFGGYVGDTRNRKTLSVVSMFMMAVYHVMIGIFIDPIFILLALIIISSMEVTKGGSSAYIMDNIPREHSGFALSLFTAGRALSIITLAVFAFLFPLVGFEAYRQIHLIGGVLLIGCTIARALYLRGGFQKQRAAGTKLWRVFLEDNRRAIRLLLKMLPGMMIVCILDAISDSFFKLGALIYINDVLLIDIQSISIMMIVTLIIQVPLLLKVGRFSDRKGVKSTAIFVYSFMPISAALLILASWIPEWAPTSFVATVNSFAPGLGVVFKVSFLAVVLKYVNDTLWYTMMLVLIRKMLSNQDTSKILSMFWFVIYLVASIGPLVAGFISETIDLLYLFFGVLFLNILILITIVRFNLVSKKEIS